MARRLMLTALVAGAPLLAPLVRSEPPDKPGTVADAIVQVARMSEPTFEGTKRVRNDRLNQLFRDYVRGQGSQVTAELVRQFHLLLRQQGLSSFDDFLAAETTPLRYRKDPASGEQVPVFGPLGSDVINSWLGDLQVLPGQPVEEQPIYRLAAKALREHLDFALIGLQDPNLSLAQLPPKLRENAEEAYRRLNPTNRFGGGLDHALFYATVREAAKKLFRHDYPHLKLTMAEVVLPEAAGGFGIRSCLLCHNRDHTGVYQRLLGQGLYLEARAAEAPEGSARAAEVKAKAASFLQAAETVRRTFPNHVDAVAARKPLAELSRDNLARLRPGYPDFCATLHKLGCLSCHGNGGKPPADRNPADYGAYVLDLNDYHQTANIKALLAVIDLDNLNQSKLLLKATARMRHEGSEDVKLNGPQAEELRAALAKWVHGFNGSAETPPHPRK